VHSRLSSGQDAFRQDEERKEDPHPLDEFVFTLNSGEVVHCNKRPGLDLFLKTATKEYELMAYTAGIESYASPLLDYLDPKETFFDIAFTATRVYTLVVYTQKTWHASTDP